MFSFKRFHPRYIRTSTVKMSKSSKLLLAQIDLSIKKLSANNFDETDSRISNEIKHSAAKLLLKALKRIPFAERSIEWSERYVQIYTLYGKKVARCRSLDSKIIQKYLAEKKLSSIESYRARIEVASGGKLYGNHGFTFPLKNVDTSVLTDELVRMVKLLESIGYTVFLNSGTLLGAQRDSNFIKYDDDIDLGVYLGERDEEEVISDMIILLSNLKKNVGDNCGCEISMKSPIVKFKFKSQVLVDIFPSWSKDDKLFIWPYCFGELSTHVLMPLSEKSINNYKFPAPFNINAILNQNYGKNWNIPDQYFKFNWQRAKEKFHKLIALYEKFET